MTDLSCIKTYNNKVEAEIAKGLLEANGIKAIVSVDDCGGMRPHLQLSVWGVRLLVKREDAQKALEVLGDFDDGAEGGT